MDISLHYQIKQLKNKTMKHTQGKVRVNYSMIVSRSEDSYEFTIATLGTLGIIKEEAEANAELIAEAFNVTNECGLTPRQLLEQRNELLDALKLIDILYGDREDFIEPYKSAWYKSKQAIKNATI